MGYEGEWYQVIDTQGEREVAQTETVMQNAFSFTGSFDDIRGFSQTEFETLASSYGIDTSSGLYSFYRDDIYQISQDVVSGNIGSAQELYEALPWSAKIFISQENANQAWNMILQYQ